MDKNEFARPDEVVFMGEVLPADLQVTSEDFCPEDDDDYEEEYISEADFARGEGFWIDEDGHWVPIDDDDWY